MKKQIDFDFTKSSNYYYGMVNGTTCFNVTKSYLTMYEEVKPREFWVNVYGDAYSKFCYDTKEQAQEYLAKGGKAIKLVEVIE